MQSPGSVSCEAGDAAGNAQSRSIRADVGGPLLISARRRSKEERAISSFSLRDAVPGIRLLGPMRRLLCIERCRLLRAIRCHGARPRLRLSAARELQAQYRLAIAQAACAMPAQVTAAARVANAILINEFDARKSPAERHIFRQCRAPSSAMIHRHRLRAECMLDDMLI